MLLQNLGIATHIYLVDEIEASAKLKEPIWVQSFVRPMLARVLENSDSVFAISEGFVDYLKSEFQCRAKWLPLPAKHSPAVQKMQLSSIKETRNIVFIGGISSLYASALKDIYEEICIINTSQKSGVPLLFLEVLSYGTSESIESLLSHQNFLIFRQNLPSQDRIRIMSESVACFLPYSFLESERTMVSTSFSCKILEYFESGSPILVYGPAYASIPKYFIQENLPLCTTSRRELRQALLDIDSVSKSDYLEKYQFAWKKNHAPSSFREKVFETI